MLTDEELKRMEMPLQDPVEEGEEKLLLIHELRKARAEIERLKNKCEDDCPCDYVAADYVKARRDVNDG